MRQFVVITACVVLLLGFNGCQKAVEKKNTVNKIKSDVAPAIDKRVDVFVDGNSVFPQFLVGTWKADNGKWEFVFEPDGVISSAVIDSGMVRVNPSIEIATFNLRDNGKATFKLGRWTVRYSPARRELAVEVVVYEFNYDMGSYKLMGNSIDWFVGPVSKITNIWKAEWSTFPEYILMAPDPNELYVDPNDNPVDTIIFRRQEKP
jgi:hypothetical protein